MRGDGENGDAVDGGVSQQAECRLGGTLPTGRDRDFYQ
jgi:hypothetical protein